MTAAVPSLALGGPRVRTPRSAARVWTSDNPGAIGAFRVHNEPSQPAPRAPERGHRNEWPHAGVRFAGD
jgi:hypothetical protein